MRKTTIENTPLIEAAYLNLRQPLFFFFRKHITDEEVCRDLVQDVFLRLLEYGQMVGKTTIQQFVFTIARNLMFDHLRRSFVEESATSYIYDTMPIVCNQTEETLFVRDILSLEQVRISSLPEQRRVVYFLSRFEEKGLAEIAKMLHLSRRTVENHLYISRKEVRDYIRQCI